MVAILHSNEKMKNFVRYHPVMIIPAQFGFIQVWTHHDIAEILLELALNTTQSINVVVDVLVNFVNSSMRKFKTSADAGFQVRRASIF
jgi:hypothetical protein